jgi:hypothetical protein
MYVYVHVIDVFRNKYICRLISRYIHILIYTFKKHVFIYMYLYTGKERLMKPIIETEVRCEVVNPLLEIIDREVDFQYIWEENQEPSVQRKDIKLKNVSALMLNFILKVEVRQYICICVLVYTRILIYT